MEKKCKKAKWLSEEALQIAVKQRKVKSKGEKERYTHLNAEFQRIARRDKKPFLSDQCKEVKENNRMGKARDFSKKIRNTKGTFHAKMGSIKDRNGMVPTEAEDIKKRQQRISIARALLKKSQINLSNKLLMKRSLSFPFYCFPLFLCIDHRGRLSYLFLLFFGTLHSNGCIFPFSFAFSFSSFLSY